MEEEDEVEEEEGGREGVREGGHACVMCFSLWDEGGSALFPFYRCRTCAVLVHAACRYVLPSLPPSLLPSLRPSHHPSLPVLLRSFAHAALTCPPQPSLQLQLREKGTLAPAGKEGGREGGMEGGSTAGRLQGKKAFTYFFPPSLPQTQPSGCYHPPPEASIRPPSHPPPSLPPSLPFFLRPHPPQRPWCHHPAPEASIRPPPPSRHGCLCQIRPVALERKGKPSLPPSLPSSFPFPPSLPSLDENHPGRSGHRAGQSISSSLPPSLPPSLPSSIPSPR